MFFNPTGFLQPITVNLKIVFPTIEMLYFLDIMRGMELPQKILMQTIDPLKIVELYNLSDATIIHRIFETKSSFHVK